MKKTLFPRPALLAVLVAATCATSAHAGKTVSWEDLLNDDKTPQDVLSYGLGLKAQRHSTLAKVNTRNVANLVPAWSFSFGGEKQRGQEGQALVHEEVKTVWVMQLADLSEQGEDKKRDRVQGLTEKRFEKYHPDHTVRPFRSIPSSPGLDPSAPGSLKQ